jgi:hypothetical protein
MMDNSSPVTLEGVVEKAITRSKEKDSTTEITLAYDETIYTIAGNVRLNKGENVKLFLAKGTSAPELFAVEVWDEKYQNMKYRHEISDNLKVRYSPD